MQQSDSENSLLTALTAFETNLNTPIVSGELADWVKRVQKSWTEAAEQIHYRCQQLHPRQYQQIAKEDPELLSRIDQLKEEDEAMEQERESVNTGIARLADHVPKLEPDEERAGKHVEKMVSDGITLVARVRKQEVAVQTWFMEAFNRDRGVSG